MFLALGFTAPSPASAQEPEPRPPPPSPTPAEARKVVVLAPRGDTLNPEGLRAALAAELGAKVVFENERGARPITGIVIVNYRLANRELAVTWDSDGQTLSRVIASSDDPDRVIADSALLAGNLAREQLPSSTKPSTRPSPPESAPPEATAAKIPVALPPRRAPNVVFASSPLRTAQTLPPRSHAFERR